MGKIQINDRSLPGALAVATAIAKTALDWTRGLSRDTKCDYFYRTFEKLAKSQNPVNSMKKSQAIDKDYHLRSFLAYKQLE